MIQTIKLNELPDEMLKDLGSRISRIDYIPLRELSYQTGLSINTLRKLREKKEASYKVWRVLIEKL